MAALAAAALFGCGGAVEPGRAPPARHPPSDPPRGPHEPLGPLGPPGDPAAAAPALVAGEGGSDLDGVLLDPRAGVAWWGSARGLEAWDLHTGKTFWRGTRPARPLDLVRAPGEVAVVERDGAHTVLALYRADRAGGRADRGLVSDDLGAPGGILFGRSGSTLRFWTVLAPDAVLLGWETGSYWVGGAPPPPGPPPLPVRGGARVDLRIGRVARLDPPPAPPDEPVLAPALDRMLSDSYSRAGGWCCSAAPLHRNGQVAALWCEAGSTPELRRFDAASGKELERRSFLDAPCYAAAFSRDGGHLVVVRDGHDPSAELWALDGRGRVGRTSTGSCRMDLWVLGDAVYCIATSATGRDGFASALVRAFDLRSGRLLWERPLTPFDARPRA